MIKETTWLPLYLKPQWNIHTQYTMHICTHIHKHILAISVLTSCHVRVDLLTGLSISCHYFTYLSIWGQILLNFNLSQLYDRLDFSLNTLRKHSRLLCMSDSLPGYVLIIFCCSAYLSGLGILSQGFFYGCSQYHYTRSHQNYSASYHSIVI